ncbi:MAG: hypothetical protein DHS20C20_28460 [Ardenticatenaceae bacterium]|nr:MAG: hypothetical protein DHS20C20_28460 [Ardenticatenaceae bacterium]
MHVIGTIGLMLKAKQNGLINEIRPFLKQLQHEGFYISEQLFSGILQQANEIAD